MFIPLRLSHEVVEKRLFSYVSTFRHTLDGRGRVTVPSSWRVDGDEQNYYLAWVSPEGCVIFYPPDMQQELEAKLRDFKGTAAQLRDARRTIFGNGSFMGCDKQGRILLPDLIRTRAKIQKDVVLVGVGRSFEIWPAERFAEPENDATEVMDALGV